MAVGSEVDPKAGNARSSKRAPQAKRAAGAARDTLFAFDLSTAVRWSGLAVGIVRVERELGRQAARHFGDRLRYCVYDLQHHTFRVLRQDIALEVIEGRVQIDLGNGPTPAPTRPIDLDLLAEIRGHLLRRPRLFRLMQTVRGRDVSLEQIHALRAALPAPSMTQRQILREFLLRRPRAYQFLQSLRGRSLSIAQIAQIRTEEARRRAEAAAKPEDQPTVVRLSLAEAVEGDLPVGPDTVVISGGLDWETKNLREIYTRKKTHGFRYAAVLYDLIPLNLPHYVVPHYVDLLTDYFGELFWTADYLMCISERTRDDALQYCADNGMTPPAISHFPLGGDLPPAKIQAELPKVLEGKRYAIFVSTIEPRKNHRTLYEAWNHAVRSGQVDPETCKLVFVGRPGWSVSELMHEIKHNPATKDSIVLMEGVSDALLDTLYKRAEFGLFPSHYEGYGLPLAEMLSRGLPCISSPAGSLPEVGRSLVVYKDTIDVKGWSEEIVRFFSEPKLLAAHRKAIRETYVPVTWEAAARAFFERLESLVKS